MASSNTDTVEISSEESQENELPDLQYSRKKAAKTKMASSNNDIIDISSGESQESLPDLKYSKPPLHDQKRRKIRMTDSDILEYNKTESGGLPLANPNLVKRSSKDPNRGLQPRPNRKNMPSGFQSARSLLSPTLPFLPVSSPSKPAPGSPSRRPYTSELSCSPSSSPSKLKSVMRSPIKPTQPGSILHFCVPVSSASSTQSSPSCSQSSPSLNHHHPTSSQASSELSSEARFSTMPSSSDDNKSIPKKEEINLSQRLFQAQRQVASASGKGGAGKSNKKKLLKPNFVPKKDNKFLYPDSDDSQDRVDPLSMGVKAKLVSADSDSDSITEEGSYFDDLPTEIVENIFCRLPFLDLHLSLTRVCSQWNDIISDTKFIPWKKKYYMIKMNQSGPDIRNVYREMETNGMTTVDSYLTGLIKYMVGYKRCDPKITTSLKKHKKYEWALDLLKERLPKCIVDESPNPWCLIATLCLIASSVPDITEVIECLLAGDTYLMALDVVECLYCVATFLLCFKALKYQDVWTCMHYKVYYALYLFENEGVSMSSQLSDVFKHGGQQSIVKYSANKEVQLTHEQMRIVKYDARPGDIAKIVAFAGTGKTTTLVKYTKLRPNKQFLLVVFNTSVKDHAIKIFPSNVTCKTGHALAFRSVGSRYMSRDNKKKGYEKRKFAPGLKIATILHLIQARKGISLYVQAKFVMDTLNRFMCSAEDFITIAHVPSRMIADDGKVTDIDHEQQMRISHDAESVWKRMVNLDDVGAPMTHDGYLKLYQLKKPQLYGYDVILIDEAQDLTPAVNDILTQQQVAKIFVGDPHQQIYAFRGAVNAMNLVQATHTFYLTQSFRFGPEIGFVASSALEFLKGEKKRTLVGNGNDSGIDGERVGQLAVITRTNFNLFSEAVKMCCERNEDIKVAFAGGTDGFGFPMIKSIYALMVPKDQRKPQHDKDLKSSFVGKFSSLVELEKYANKTIDNELMGKIKIVKTYNHRLPALMEKILQKTVSIPEAADVVLSTAHKAKGLEFSTVRLTDDFNVTPNPITSHLYGINQPMEDEANLLYVAVTRAKKRLIITRTLVSLLSLSGERFLYPSHSEKLQKEGTVFKCLQTDADFKPLSLTLQKRQVTMSDGSTRPGGLLSPQIVMEEFSSLKRLYGTLQEDVHDSDIENAAERRERENNEEWNFGLFDNFDEDLGRAGALMGLGVFP